MGIDSTELGRGARLSDGVLTRRDLVLQKLRESSGPRTIVSLADELGVHPNTVRFHVDSLISSGRVERFLGPTAGVGRPPARYRVAVGMNPNGPTNYRMLAAVLTGHLIDSSSDPARTATSLGRTWGRRLIGSDATAANVPAPDIAPSAGSSAVSRVVGVLEDLGFEPEPVAVDAREIRLRHCPFLDLVAANAKAICSLHLGLMQGAFASLDAQVTVDRLDPFVRPDLCVATLAVATLSAPEGDG